MANDSGSTRVLCLDLSEKLANQNIAESFALNSNGYFVLRLNHEYESKTIPYQFDFSHYQKSLQSFEARLKDKGMAEEHAKMIVDIIDDNHERIIDFVKNYESAADLQASDGHHKRVQKAIRKYTSNGTLPLHECIVFADRQQQQAHHEQRQQSPSTFLYLDEDHRPQYVSEIETWNERFYPADTLHTQNPLPYVFESPAELERYLKLAAKETLETLHSKVESIFKKYVNVEDYYATKLSADILYSYFQDKFGTTHYNIFVGDNGSGKNSALLVFKYLGYRVFYGLDMSAPNYFTFLGDTEECQGSTAEDEAQDIAYDIEKQKIVKGGYCSGATVPKVDTSFGRRQDTWLTYCHKWFAMEELPDHKKIKGILDRSFLYNFVVGHTPYNIKDVIRSAGDVEYKGLYDELIHVRKLLFCFRLLHHGDVIPEVKLNVIHRNAELTKPLLRLFSYHNDSPAALNKIRLALSKFILSRNEAKKNSVESKLLEAINSLTKARNEQPQLFDNDLADYSFYNEQIFGYVREATDGRDIPGKNASFYSTEYGAISHKRIAGLYKSKLKAEPFLLRTKDDGVKRGLKFSKEWLERLDLYYNVPDEIKFVTDVTDVTDRGSVGGGNSTENEGNSCALENISHPFDEKNNCKTDSAKPPEFVTSVTSVTNQKTEYEKYVEEQAVRTKQVLEEGQLTFQTYVHRISPNSVMWDCDYCKYRDDKWGMAKHSHTPEEMSKGPRKRKT